MGALKFTVRWCSVWKKLKDVHRSWSQLLEESHFGFLSVQSGIYSVQTSLRLFGPCQGPWSCLSLHQLLKSIGFVCKGKSLGFRLPPGEVFLDNPRAFQQFLPDWPDQCPSIHISYMIRSGHLTVRLFRFQRHTRVFTSFPSFLPSCLPSSLTNEREEDYTL